MNIIDCIPTGIENAVTRSELCALTNLDDRTMRREIAKARRDYAILTSNDRKGYYLPEDCAKARREMLNGICTKSNVEEAEKALENQRKQSR